MNNQKHLPPVVGEYGYYHSPKVESNIKINYGPYWICEFKLDDGTIVTGRAVHYSMNINNGGAPFINIHSGKIIKIGKLIRSNNY